MIYNNFLIDIYFWFGQLYTVHPEPATAQVWLSGQVCKLVTWVKLPIFTQFSPPNLPKTHLGGWFLGVFGHQGYTKYTAPAAIEKVFEQAGIKGFKFTFVIVSQGSSEDECDFILSSQGKVEIILKSDFSLSLFSQLVSWLARLSTRLPQEGLEFCIILPPVCCLFMFHMTYLNWLVTPSKGQATN